MYSNLAATTLTGGAGDDNYVIQNTGGRIVELTGEGNDNVLTTANHTLEANVENLILTGIVATIGTGNAINNILQSNLAATTLTGGAGVSPLPVARVRANGEG